MKKRLVYGFLAAAVAVTLAGCGGAGSSAESEETAVSEETADAESDESDLDMPVAVEKTDDEAGEDGVALENPFIECKSIEIAAKAAGFEMAMPSLPEGYEATTFRAMADTMIEVICSDNAGSELRLRKATGTDDVSGDYNEYSAEEDVSVGELTVNEKSDSDGVRNATWISGDYSYAILSDKGLSADQVAELVSGITEA